MREVRRQVQRSKPVLRRSADGSLRAASGDADIADIWAERDRIRLAEAIERDALKCEKKRRRRERGLFGGGKAAPNLSAAAKEIEIKISLPKLHLAQRLRQIKQKVPRLTKKQWALLGGAGLLIAFIIVTRGVYDQSNKAKHGTKGVSGATSQAIGGDKPEFKTLLPAGKKVEDLGGWGRVSPPTSAPVFAYSDILAGTHVVVSEQEMPANFDAQQIAKQFGATKKVQTKGGLEAYTGLVANGTESVVFTKQHLLILIRSSGPLNDQSLGDYIDDLN